ncbi:MAG TPA: hypothetical protein VJH03_00255 [Blastocatellia bacterium]|nr:hypothetical protein [Blastocatellia bacterium]
MTRQERRFWTGRFEEKFKTAQSAHAPLVVLWGPGRHDIEGFRKRQKLARAIRRESPTASVLYPEEQTSVAITRPYASGADRQEAFQAIAADLVFALDIAPGVSEEIARYSVNQDIARRLIVIAPESKRHGYTGIVRQALNVSFLRDSELRDCRSASAVCKREIRAWLIGKLLEEGLAYR